MTVLVTGWFSFERAGATAGDLLARDLACEWLDEAGRAYDVAHTPPFGVGVDWRTVDQRRYSEVVFVCGPTRSRKPLTELLDRFSQCRMTALNVSLFEPLESWNPFDVLFERDSVRTLRPDITFLSRQPLVPAVGLILIDRTFGYQRPMENTATEAIERLLALREMAVVRIDTRLDSNSSGLRSPAEVESLIARMDVVITTRLHGMVLALKNGVPALAVDPIGGGGKVRPQAEAIGWPIVFTADSVNQEALRKALHYCLSEEARAAAVKCSEHAKRLLLKTRSEFISAMRHDRKL